MKILFVLLVCYLAASSARPQSEEQYHPEPAVHYVFRVTPGSAEEGVSSDSVEIIPSQSFEIIEKEPKSIDLAATHLIWNNIDKINRQHAVTKKQLIAKGKTNDLREVLSNPILEYILEQQKLGNSKGFHYAETDENADILPEDEVAGETIKRKITHHQTFMIPVQDIPMNLENVDGKLEHPYYYYPNVNSLSRQGTINIPLQEYFPIVIRNPFQMMFNALTSMVEYGPPSANCKSGDKRSGKVLEGNDLEHHVRNHQKHSRAENPKVKVEKPTLFKPSTWLNNKITKQPASTTTTTTLKPNEQMYEQLGEDYSEEEISNIDTADKGFLAALHNGQRKNISKDNTGSGIFINKLKVRKGGVAIAGPGGIATAGSGGTAIVGPNGVAYTHPDSLAIAGSGTKVVAVDPSINLGDLVNATKAGGTRPRVGKVVATGPVIYYNKG